ncbi:uncharacterized protein LOC113369334, partial [Ctenocephalides felis]
FVDERNSLLEVVGPELQAIYNERKIEVEIVDFHYGADEKDSAECPSSLKDIFCEIQICHDVSKGCFFIGLLSDSNLNTDKILPVRIKAQLFHELIENIKLIHDIGKLQEHEKFEEFDDIDSDVDLVKQWYIKEDTLYILKDYSNVSYEEWHRTKSNLIRALKNIIGMNCWILQKIEDLNKSDKLTSSSDNFSSFNCKFSNLLKNKCTFLKDIKMLLRSTMEVLCLNTL